MGGLFCKPPPVHPAEEESAPCCLCHEIIPPTDNSHRTACLVAHKAEYDALPDSDLYTCKPCSHPLKVMTESALTEAQTFCLKCWQQEFVQKEMLLCPDNKVRARAELKYGKRMLHFCFVCNKSLCHFHGKGAMDMTNVHSIPRNTASFPLQLSS